MKIKDIFFTKKAEEFKHPAHLNFSQFSEKVHQHVSDRESLLEVLSIVEKMHDSYLSHSLCKQIANEIQYKDSKINELVGKEVIEQSLSKAK